MPKIKTHSGAKKRFIFGKLRLARQDDRGSYRAVCLA